MGMLATMNNNSSEMRAIIKWVYTAEARAIKLIVQNVNKYSLVATWLSFLQRHNNVLVRWFKSIICIVTSNVFFSSVLWQRVAQKSLDTVGSVLNIQCQAKALYRHLYNNGVSLTLSLHKTSNPILYQTPPHKAFSLPLAAFCIGISFPAGKAGGMWRYSLTPFSSEVKDKVELYFYSQSGPSWPVLG